LIFLLVEKWRGAINIASMRYFPDKEALKAHVSQSNPESWQWHHAYRVYPDREAKHLLLNELREIGLRPPKGA